MRYYNVVGKCNKFNKYVVLQVEKTGTEEGKIVGCFGSGSTKKFDSQIFVRRLTVKDPCARCRATTNGACHCAEATCTGAPGKACQTCAQLQLDYSRTVGRTTYGQNAGINEVAGARDRFGNALGSDADLGRDGAFAGKRMLVLWLYNWSDADAQKGKNNIVPALQQKGFTVDFRTAIGSPAELQAALDNTCQCWIVSDSHQVMNDQHYDIIERYYRAGRGLYLWGDNDPYSVDANNLAKRLFGVTMAGNYYADQVIGISDGAGRPGILRGHLLSTGIVNFYEGITIATVQTNQMVRPLAYSSDGNVVSAYVDADYCRCLLDGGFTRMYCAWDKAGTDRYIKNCAAWLANYERFFEEYC